MRAGRAGNWRPRRQRQPPRRPDTGTSSCHRSARLRPACRPHHSTGTRARLRSGTTVIAHTSRARAFLPAVFSRSAGPLPPPLIPTFHIIAAGRFNNRWVYYMIGNAGPTSDRSAAIGFIISPHLLGSGQAGFLLGLRRRYRRRTPAPSITRRIHRQRTRRRTPPPRAAHPFHAPASHAIRHRV